MVGENATEEIREKTTYKRNFLFEVTYVGAECSLPAKTEMILKSLKGASCTQVCVVQLLITISLYLIRTEPTRLG